MKTVIIGAGASGLACAIRLKQNIPSARITVLERLETPGKKILATGNGRCNITNKNAIGYKTAAAFFEDLGLMLLSEDGGRVYPYSQKKRKPGLPFLLDKCNELGIKNNNRMHGKKDFAEFNRAYRPRCV
ncbi:MAG: NAD(P)/FAD-dependent oxidoreductase [Anaerotruncus sp.]|nr:MAG: NAD(P)/FAD-dependent oxidoreductase [Anaerotruncus sp.]